MDKLFKLTGFIPFIVIIFLNAFVDLGHKILIQNTVFKIYDGQAQIIQSGQQASCGGEFVPQGHTGPGKIPESGRRKPGYVPGPGDYWAPRSVNRPAGCQLQYGVNQ